MRSKRFLKKPLLFLSGAISMWFLATSACGQKNPEFEKKTLLADFISEGTAVADINKDGKPDIIAGAYWFEAPDWKKKELAKPQKFIYNEGYSDSFLQFAVDANLDGWPDVVRVDFPGKPAIIHMNPQGKPGLWQTKVLNKSIGNESPMMVDVNGDGHLDMLGNDSEDKKVIWVEAPGAPDGDWKAHVISNVDTLGTHMFTHGIGFGDINKDGRKDVLIRQGWWEAPADPTQPDWRFHEAPLGEECSQMYVIDANQDGLPDVLTASAHRYGIWWHEQGKDASGNQTWKTHSIDSTFSQTHGVALVDLNSDGNLDFVTGKRYYAHNGHDVGAEQPAVIKWFEFNPGKNPTWVAHEIDNNSGIGLQVVVEDVDKDGKLDIVTANKKGVHYFHQK